MTTTNRGPSLNRRQLLAGGSALAAAPLLSRDAAAADARSANTVRDRFWLWGHPAGAHNRAWNLPKPSQITPVEAAYYMGTPNVILVRYEGNPPMPFDQYAIPFLSLKQVVWSVVGASGATATEEREAVLAMAEKYPNFAGVDMDDFFFDKSKDGRTAALSVDQLRDLQKRLKGGSKKLDLWVTLYTHQLDDPIKDHLAYCDVVTLWTWKAQDLDKLPASFDKCQQIAPKSRIVLGCYMYDYGTKTPMPVDAMRRQSEQGLEWLQQGRIDGMIFLASCICDIGLESVEWTRQWIQKVGDRKLTRQKAPRRT